MSDKLELKQLYINTLKLFGISEQSEGSGAKELGEHLMQSLNDTQIMDGFCEIVGGDLTKDWLQMIYQYYLADRKDKKQDYTPANLANLLGTLAGDADVIVDLCAGSGALTIQKWCNNPDQEFELYEVDENVIPYLLFNLAIRNIKSTVFLCDVLQDETRNAWKVTKGEKYGKVTSL